ncbi:hypothetical protein CHUAL_010255 [Chamberlinius hualienensis]
MSFFKLTLVIAIIAACNAEHGWTKCEPSEMHLNAFKECLKSELEIDPEGKDLKEIAKSTPHESLAKVMVCSLKKKGVLTENMEYVEEKALECIDVIKTEDSIKKELKEGVIACGKDLDHKSPEDQKKIFKCTKDLMKEVFNLLIVIVQLINSLSSFI